MKRGWPLLLLALAAPAAAASLSIVKSSALVDDPVNGAVVPRAIPGATVDYALVVTNPLANLLTPVRTVVLVDPVPAAAAFRIVDYAAAGEGPVQFNDGTVLLLLGSGLSYNYGGLGSTTDGLEFSNGSSWSYVPQNDGSGHDPAVRAIRVTMTGTQIAGGSFRLRYRVRLH